MNNKSSNKIIGKFGEDTACLYLEKLGWKILERNFHYSRYSEIDIIAKDGSTIVFVEVKTRTTTNFGHPFEAVNYKKLRNIFMAGLAFLKTNTEPYKRYRIDIISVIGRPETKNQSKIRPKNEHINDQAFEPIIEHLKDVSLN